MGKDKLLGNQLEVALSALEREWSETLFKSLPRRAQVCFLLEREDVDSKRLRVGLMREKDGCIELLGRAMYKRVCELSKPEEVYGCNTEDLDRWEKEIQGFDRYAGLRENAQRKTAEIAYLLGLGPKPEDWVIIK